MAHGNLIDGEEDSGLTIMGSSGPGCFIGGPGSKFLSGDGPGTKYFWGGVRSFINCEDGAVCYIMNYRYNPIQFCWFDLVNCRYGPPTINTLIGR
jgi:hypothetical protein